MLLFIILLLSTLPVNEDNIIFDFNTAQSSGDWMIVNDDVMGGISKSKFELNEDSTATFSGSVFPDNNGGFASVRTSLKNEWEDTFNGVKIMVKGDGKIFSLRFRTDLYFDGMSYQSKFKTKADQWAEYKLPLDKFMPTYRGRTLYNKKPLNSKDIEQIAILIADKQFGDFKISVDWIKFY